MANGVKGGGLGPEAGGRCLPGGWEIGRGGSGLPLFHPKDDLRDFKD